MRTVPSGPLYAIIIISKRFCGGKTLLKSVYCLSVWIGTKLDGNLGNSTDFFRTSSVNDRHILSRLKMSYFVVFKMFKAIGMVIRHHPNPNQMAIPFYYLIFLFLLYIVSVPMPFEELDLDRCRAL